MAKKRSVDIKALILAHVEKVVCAIIAVCFVMLLWFAVSKDGVPAGIEPADIQGVALQAKSNVSRTKWEDFSSKPRMRNFAQESGWYTIPFKPYEIATDLNPGCFHTQGLRDDPKYYGISDLEAHYDQGPLALLTAQYLERRFGLEGAIPNEVQKLIDESREKPIAPKKGLVDDPNRLVDEDGAVVKVKFPGEPVEDNEVSEGRRWIMVTGLVPIQKQISAYEETFRTAAGFEQKNDLPLYFGYEVERADVTGGVSPVWEQHDKVFSQSLLISTLRWTKGKKSDIIDPRYKHPIFTCPLPPRVLELWSDRDKHSRVPLKATGEREEEASDLIDGPLAGLGKGAVVDIETLVAGARKSSRQDDEDETVPVKMLRYFDFNLEPGRTYQYRFRAVLRDPNYLRDSIDGGKETRRVEIKLLEQPVVTRLNLKRKSLAEAGYDPEIVERLMQVTFTPWSDPTPTVKVPPETYLLAVSTQPATKGKYNEEPTATIMVTEYDRLLGVETGGQTTLQRGSMSEFTVDKLRVINVDYNTFDYRQQTFDPNVVLLDTRGGEALGESSLTAPAELLMFDLSNGKVIVNNEIEDLESIRKYEDRQRKLDLLIPKPEPTNGRRTGPLDIDVLN